MLNWNCVPKIGEKIHALSEGLDSDFVIFPSIYSEDDGCYTLYNITNSNNLVYLLSRNTIEETIEDSGIADAYHILYIVRDYVEIKLLNIPYRIH